MALERSTCDPVSARYQYHNQCTQANSLAGIAGLDDVAGRCGLFISSWSLAEIWNGILLMPKGKRRATLEDWYLGPSGPPRLFSGRILGFDMDAAHKWAELMAEDQRTGRTRSLPDTIIASIALTQNCVLVTDNERDFPDVPILNPMRPISS